MSESDKIKTPILRTTQVSEHGLRSNPSVDARTIREAVDLEDDVYALQYLREEMTGLFDLVSENFTYPDLINSELFTTENCPVPKEKMQELIDGQKDLEDMIGNSIESINKDGGLLNTPAVQTEIRKYVDIGLPEETVTSFFNDPDTYRYGDIYEKDLEAAGEEKAKQSSPKRQPIGKGAVIRTSDHNLIAPTPLTGKHSLDLKNAIRALTFARLEKQIADRELDEAAAQKTHTRFKILAHSQDAPSQILMEDFLNLKEEGDEATQDTLSGLLLESLGHNLRKHFEEKQQKSKEKISDKQIENMAAQRTDAMICYFEILMERIRQLREMEKSLLEGGGREKVQIYRKTFHKQLRETIKNLKKISSTVVGAKETKNVTSVQKADTLEIQHKLQPGTVTRINERLARVYEKKYGKARQYKPDVRSIYDEHGNLVNKDFLTAYINYSKELHKLHQLMNRGKIVETDYVKSIIEKALPNLTKNPPIIVYFHGDTGTGKTALATHISRTVFHTEPIIVSGSKFLEPDRFTEEFKIERRDPVAFFNDMLRNFGTKAKLKNDDDMTEIFSTIVGEKQDIVAKITENRRQKTGQAELTAEEKKEIEQMVNDAFANPVQGRYILGAMYLAMQEGRPLIIDEANAISPEVLIAFNDLMTKKVGDKIYVRTAEKMIEVKQGFCVIWTGNTGHRYKGGRYNDLDPATFNRIAPIKVQYLPQSTTELSSLAEKTKRLELNRISESLVDETDQDQTVPEIGKLADIKKQAKNDQIFQVLFSKVLNRRLGAWVLTKKDDPDSFVKDLYRLSVAARILMNIFEGNIESSTSFQSPDLVRLVGDDSAVAIRRKLLKTNLTMRTLLDKIVSSYLEDGGAMDLEYYIFRFVSELDMFPEEMAIVYQMFRNAGFFDPARGWINLADCPDLETLVKKTNTFDPTKSVDKYERVEINGDYVSMLRSDGGDSGYVMRYYSPLESTQLMFGFLPPRRLEDYQKIAATKSREEEAGRPEIEKAQKLMDALDEISVITSGMIYKLFKYKHKLDEISEDEASEVIEKEIEPAIIEFENQQKGFRLTDETYLNSLDYEALVQAISGYCDFILQKLAELNIISQEEADKISAAPGVDKISMTSQLVRDINTKLK